MTPYTKRKHESLDLSHLPNYRPKRHENSSHKTLRDHDVCTCVCIEAWCLSHSPAVTRLSTIYPAVILLLHQCCDMRVVDN